MNNNQFNNSKTPSGYNYDVEYIRNLTGISSSEEDKLIRFFYRLGPRARVEAFKLEMDFYRKHFHKRERNKIPEFTYAMFLLALKAMHKIELQLKIKKALSLEEAEKITRLRIERIKAQKRAKKSKKREYIEQNLPLIKQLRDAGLSWRDIAAYIKKYHRVKIAPSYLHMIYKEILGSEEEKSD
jgi:hypothetical protein